MVASLRRVEDRYFSVSSNSDSWTIDYTYISVAVASFQPIIGGGLTFPTLLPL